MYKHTQVSYPMIILFCGFAIYAIANFISARAEVPSYDSGTNLLVNIITLAVLFVIACFFKMTVTVDEERLSFAIGGWFFRKSFLRSNIASVKPVRNYINWGIKWWFGIWSYSVGGFDAIEIATQSGKKYRIGTDDQTGLLNALNAESQRLA